MLQGIFDSHAHYDDERFDPDRDSVLTGLLKQGVFRIVNVASDLKSSQQGIALGEKYPFIYSSVGVHPHSAQEVTPDALDQLQALSRQKKVCAIGEIGLDYYYDFSPRDVQREAFAQQLELAGQLNMPVIIHSRDAVADTMDLLRLYRPKGIVHCFSGAVEMAREVLNLGLYLGFTGALTFKNARKAVEVVEYAPIDRLLLETDCPYMAPEPHRGKRCDSSMIAFTAQRMAQIKGVDPQQMVTIASENTKQVYEMDE